MQSRSRPTLSALLGAAFATALASVAACGGESQDLCPAVCEEQATSACAPSAPPADECIARCSEVQVSLAARGCREEWDEALRCFADYFATCTTEREFWQGTSDRPCEDAEDDLNDCTGEYPE